MYKKHFIFLNFSSVNFADVWELAKKQEETENLFLEGPSCAHI